MSRETVVCRETIVCRDFLRNVCQRGNQCKFHHTDSPHTVVKKDVEFCHDYQNKECNRNNCKFIHCTRQEQAVYEATGKLPLQILDSSSNGRGASSNGFHNKKGEIPICMDFLKSECHRAGRCKFRHLSSLEYEREMRMMMKNKDPLSGYDYGGASYEPEAKRPRLINELYSNRHEALLVPTSFGSQEMRLIEDEISLLRRKVEDLQKQISELQATNTYLFEQNTQLRMSKQTTTVTPLTQTLIPHSMASMTSTATATLPSTITQISLSSGDLTAATQTTLRPSQALATELTTQNIVAPVSISTVPVTFTQTIPAASLAQSLAQSIITMSAPTTSLVSYPIMTQNLQPVITHSLRQ